MENIVNSFKVDLPFTDLTLVADLIEYEGPLLCWLQRPNGDQYFYNWFDSDDTGNRWMLVQLTDDQVMAYIKGKLSLFQVLSKPEQPFCYLCDVDDAGDLLSCQLTMVDQIPADYLPDPDSFYSDEPQFAPNQWINFGLTGNWNLNQIADLSKHNTLFIDLLSAMTPEVQEQLGEGLLSVFRRNVWGGGSHAFLYRDLRQLSAEHQLSQLQSVNLASPGKVVMQVSPPVRANALRVVRQLKDSHNIRSIYAQANKLISSINQGREANVYLVHPDDHWVSDFRNVSLEPSQAKEMTKLIKDMAGALDLEDAVQSFLKATGSHFIVFQTLRACIRSLKKIDRFVLDGQISQIGETLF